MGFTAGYKLNAGTQYEFTVSNETIPEAVAAEGGITEADIADYCYTALVDSRIETVKAESHTDVQQPGWASWCQDHAMFYYINNTRYINSNVGINNSSDTVYERNFLIWYGTIYPGEPEEKTGWFLIMDIKDIKKFYVDFSNAGFGQTTVASTRTDGGVTTPFTGYSGDAYTYNSSLANVYPNIYTDDDQITTIRVINVLNINDELWIGRLNPSNYGEASTAYSTYGYAMYIDYKLTGWLSTSDNEHFFQKGSISWAGVPKIIDMDYPDLGFDVSPVIRSYAESTDDMILDISAEHYGGFPVATSAVPACKTLNGILKWMSWCGLLFKYGGNTYKPIIQNGVIVDFSSDMFTPSEFDTMTNVTGNNISPVPPGPAPGPEGDEIDDMTVNPLFGLNSDAGFAAYFLLTGSQLASLHTWLTDTTFPDGYDPYQYIISLIQFPMKLTPSWCLTGTGGNIVIGGEDTGISANLIGREQTWRGLGTFNIPRYNGNFLDYDPYTQYECYIPCCGWVTLPDIVAGREIVVRINYDLTDASIIGNVYVKINGDSLLVASKSGMMGRQTIVSGEAQGVRSAQITSALLSAGTGALNVAAGAISGNAVAAVSGAYHIVAGLAQTNIASNSSYARQIGSTGGKALLCQFDQCYIKITTTRAEVPSNYGHTVGYVCNKSGKVSDFSGYTVFDNVDVSNIAGATERELQIIKRTLESGVIINKPSN